jgi:hypothetical protein
MAQKTETVYIIGAGFSAGLGYPTTSNLLIEVWPRLSEDYRARLGKVIGFHQLPQWSPQNRPMVVTSKPADEKAIRTSHSFTLPG